MYVQTHFFKILFIHSYLWQLDRELMNIMMYRPLIDR